jgi:tetratricopeptide (TPR) repeat protein
MPKENKDRDAITSKAIGIASEKERDTYLAQACGDDAELRRQVEERVATHFKAHDQKEPDRKADTDAPSPEQAPEQAEENPSKRHELWNMARKHPRALSAAVIILLLLLAVAGTGAGVAVWALHKEGQARKSEKKADEKSKQAEKEEAKLKGQLHQSEEGQKVVAKERDRARKAEEEARHSEEETKAILQFFKSKLLSSGRSEESIAKDFWDGDQDKDVTLRQAVDKAASKVADVFADQPLAETSVREMLGLAYLNLGDAKQAVEQYERALALHEAMQGVNHSATATCRNQLAVAYRRAGRTAEASRLIDRNPNSSSHASALAVRGALLLSQKKPVEAELKLRECLTIRKKMQPDDWTTFDTKSMLGEALVEQKKYADAEPLLRSGYEGLKQREAKIPSQDKGRLNKALERLVQLYEAWGKKDKADQWRKELEAAKET